MRNPLIRQLAAIDAKIERVKAMRDEAIVELADHRGLEGEEREKFIRKTLDFCDRGGKGLH